MCKRLREKIDYQIQKWINKNYEHKRKSKENDTTILLFLGKKKVKIRLNSAIKFQNITKILD